MNFEKYKIEMIEPIIGHPKLKYEIYGIIDIDTGNNIPIPYIHTKPYIEMLIKQLNNAYNKGYKEGIIFKDINNNDGVIHPPITDNPRPKPSPTPEFEEK